MSNEYQNGELPAVARHPALERTLGPEDVESVDTAAGWRRLQQRRLAQPPRRVHRGGWLAMAAGVALVGALGFSSSARSATAELLSLFRITNVAALPVDVGSAPLNNPSTGALVRQVMQDEVTVTNNEPNKTVADATAAGALAGFSVRAPEGAAWSDGEYLVRGAKDARMVVDLAQLQEIIASAGLVGAQLPASLNGAVLSAHIPRAVAIRYGDCPTGDGAAAGGNCTVFLQSPSPSATLPAGVNVEQIAEIGMQMLGMSADEAHEYCQTVDWTSTLVVPFPRGQAQANQVPVDGVTGLLLVRGGKTAASQYALLWSRDGTLYSVAGGGNGSQGLALAAALSN